MASLQQTLLATENCDTKSQEIQAFHDVSSPQPSPVLSRRIQELRKPNTGARKRPKTRSKETAPNDSRRHHSHRWREEVLSNVGAGVSFKTRLTILKILRRIPELRDHAPQLVSSNPVARTLTIQYTRRELVPFEAEARLMHLSHDKIQGFKNQLYKFVKLMYQNGVKYTIYPQHLYFYKTASWERTRQLFLGAVTGSDLLDIGQLDWKEQRHQTWAQIDRIFAPLEIWAFQEEAAHLADYAKEQMDWAKSTIDDNNDALDAAKADHMEARAIMMEAFEIIKKACASIEGVKSSTKGIYSSIIRPHTAWDEAHFGKENAETSWKKIDVLNGRAYALIQKYGEPKPRNEVSTGGMPPHLSTKAEENSEISHNESNIGDSKAEGEVAAQNGTATDDAKSRGDAGLGT
ncbi:hypothetical protein TARUN_7888 [Trichoderma arundinaceum]|uniref:Uncharacterized protein n=1 Tax=Trichoderma arundinaceum TaxID=490622 RepID=A0A395NE44_TRIAR|nr:hypothetical protein TARUN_7888 [Trichoderma arundinaceum]